MSRKRPSRWRPALINLGVIVLLLSAVSFLPPDTSLAERQKAGFIKLCVPVSYPPFVTGDAAQPGFDVELMTRIAEGLGLRLAVNTLPTIGQDFNPRNWLLTRAQCDLIAGGVADTLQTRGFLQTLPTGVETGWVAVSADGRLPEQGATIAVMPGSSGLDRLALSGWLRADGYVARPVYDLPALAEMLASGGAQAAILERFVADQLHQMLPDSVLFWPPQDKLMHYQMALGMWKGDDTLRRAIAAEMDRLATSGALAALQEKYGLGGTLPEAADGSPEG